MKYQLTDYQGNSITIPDDKAAKIADIAGLIEVEVNGQKHYVNPSNIASIKPIRDGGYKSPKELGMPDLGVDYSTTKNNGKTIDNA
jgi:hypothetical protein